jgi:hypothetical protein
MDVPFDKATPFDKAIEAIRGLGYHNQRLETHSDVVSTALMLDLTRECAPLRADLENGVVKVWSNVPSPGKRKRNIDLFVGEPGKDGGPDIHKLRMALENKSVITAHRNRTNRFTDLEQVLSAIHGERPEALLVATVLVGLAERVLNVPDRVKMMYKGTDREQEFQDTVMPRLSSGDQKLWSEFQYGVSMNKPNDPAKTVKLMRTLPTRPAGQTHVEGYDFLFLAPVFIDNVNPPQLPRPNALGIDVDAEYRRMLEHLCAAYTARFHM